MKTTKLNKGDESQICTYNKQGHWLQWLQRSSQVTEVPEVTEVGKASEQIRSIQIVGLSKGFFK